MLAEVGIAALVVALLALALRPGLGPGALIAAAALVVLGLADAATVLIRRIRGTRRPRGRTAPQAAGRIATLAAAIVLVPAAISYIAAMTRPSNSSLSIRSVEWLRDNGGRSLVSEVERIYYSITAPAKGGPALKHLEVAGVAAAPVLTHQLPHRATPVPTAPRPHPAYRPRDITPVIHPALPGEGVWRVTQARFAHEPSPPVLVTTYRPDPSYPRVVAGLAWINHLRTHLALYTGMQEPPGATGPHAVPASGLTKLLATFNSGFKHADSNGGFFSAGHLFEPLRPGQGTIVGTTTGRLDVRAWQGGPAPPSSIAFARQNLPLIVDHHRPNPNLSDGPQWGATLGNAILVWRSGVGVDRHGNLIYAAAPYQSVSSLARMLIHAGAVRAVELDINTAWVTLNSYAYTGGRGASSLLPDMARPATRYLTPDDRDFFAVYLR
ncbi:MAG TPA: hypothetical protein VF032_15350 [Thermoleophilaceae bacterium]